MERRHKTELEEMKNYIYQGERGGGECDTRRE